MKMIDRELGGGAAAVMISGKDHISCKGLYSRMRKRSSPACLLLLPFLFLFLCFSANKLPYMRRNYRGESAAISLEDSNPCLIRASSYDQLQPFVPVDQSSLLHIAATPDVQLAASAASMNDMSSTTSSTSTSSAAAISSDKRADHSCEGKLIYTYRLPAEFNEELVRRCNVGYKRYCDKWFCIPCHRLENYGFGPKVPAAAQNMPQNVDQSDGMQYSDQVELVPKEAWYRTDQYSLEVIFYEKMKRHQCTTVNPEEASAFYIPYFGGLDLAFTLFSGRVHLMDALQQRLVGWLSGNPVWQSKRDVAPHFMVLGHVAWDFDRGPLQGDLIHHDHGKSSSSMSYSTWGSSLLHQPLLNNTSWLLIERKGNDHDMGLPFPTLFHPSSPTDIFLWQKEIRKVKRQWLVTFVGGSRRHFDNEAIRSLRQVLMRQCQEAEKDTTFFGEVMAGGNTSMKKEIACDEEPEEVMRALTKSVFCLQPKGDSATRKGFFDTIVAGCIPVLFANDTAYLQYLWHLPDEPSLYSVFIPEANVIEGRINVVDTLSHIPLTQIKLMQRTIRHLIPHIIYSPPGAIHLAQDAFSIALDSFLIHHIKQAAIS
ncbi:hypothetical protein L7F22_014912 [Adiantum nelumboides]|nr:hypothetical protein [Adiantum nelumboides]